MKRSPKIDPASSRLLTIPTALLLCNLQLLRKQEQRMKAWKPWQKSWVDADMGINRKRLTSFRKKTKRWSSYMTLATRGGIRRCSWISTELNIKNSFRTMSMMLSCILIPINRELKLFRWLSGLFQRRTLRIRSVCSRFMEKMANSLNRHTFKIGSSNIQTTTPRTAWFDC